MAGKEQEKEAEEFVYRISTAQEWEEFQKAGALYGGSLDKSTGCIHLSNLDQVLSYSSSSSLIITVTWESIILKFSPTSRFLSGRKSDLMNGRKLE